jgi:hypothetical protein
VIDSVVAALPIDEVFDQVDAALSRVEQAISTGDMLVTLLQRVDNILAGFENPQAQMDTWIESIIGRVDSLVDLTPLQPALAALADALDSTQASALASRFAAASDPLVIALDDLNPQSRLITLVQAYNGVSRQALDALPDSPEKAAISAVLDRFNPAQPTFGAPFSAMHALRQRIGSTDGAPGSVRGLGRAVP